MSSVPIDRARITQIFGSTSLRLSGLFSLLLIVAFGAAGLGVWLTTRTVAETQTRQHVQLEVEFLREEAATEGPRGVLLAIQNRTSRPGGLEYRLAASDGTRLAGNLPGDRLRPGWQFIDLQDRERGRHGADDLIVLSERLNDGSLLSVAGDLARGESVRVAVLRALIAIGAVSALLAVLLGLWITRRTLRRAEALSATMMSVAAGDFSARAPGRAPPRDDFDHLSAGANAMLDQIARLVANVRRVSTEVAHDLRTPLSHIRQDLELAGKTAQPPTLTHIETAQRRIEDVLRTFDAMLRLAEIEAGSARSRFTTVDLAQLAEKIADAYRPDVEALGGQLVVKNNDAFSVLGDPDLLAQALANLIENAMVHGGRPPIIEMAMRIEQGSGGAIIVSDQGPGIPLKFRDQVLAPFARLDESRSTPGSGLGLTIAAAVGRLHGACLDLEDGAPGLRVILRWPVAAEPMK